MKSDYRESDADEGLTRYTPPDDYEGDEEDELDE